jgi:DNA invertase Pin-like site-specific DNA recombinase
MALLARSTIRQRSVPTRSKAAPGFAALLNRIEGNGFREVLVEEASRLARDLMAQELGIGVLTKLGTAMS